MLRLWSTNLHLPGRGRCCCCCCCCCMAIAAYLSKRKWAGQWAFMVAPLIAFGHAQKQLTTSSQCKSKWLPSACPAPFRFGSQLLDLYWRNLYLLLFYMNARASERAPLSGARPMSRQPTSSFRERGAPTRGALPSTVTIELRECANTAQLHESRR